MKQKGQLVDKYKFDFDEINIQSGVYLLEWTLGILSVQHQTIHIFRIDKNSGAFVALKQIGPSVLDDDQLWDYQVNFENELIEQFFTGYFQINLILFLIFSISSTFSRIFI